MIEVASSCGNNGQCWFTEGPRHRNCQLLRQGGSLSGFWQIGVGGCQGRGIPKQQREEGVHVEHSSAILRSDLRGSLHALHTAEAKQKEHHEAHRPFQLASPPGGFTHSPGAMKQQDRLCIVQEAPREVRTLPEGADCTHTTAELPLYYPVMQAPLGEAAVSSRNKERWSRVGDAQAHVMC
uniref:Uncharacterized protein n=1 Tax=Eutreptiella gymnastica TaxID=73025 RepID=A0A7S4G688_9EUGL